MQHSIKCAHCSCGIGSFKTSKWNMEYDVCCRPTVRRMHNATSLSNYPIKDTSSFPNMINYFMNSDLAERTNIAVRPCPMTKRSNSCDFVYAVRPCGALVLILVCELPNFRQHSKWSSDAGSVCVASRHLRFSLVSKINFRLLSWAYSVYPYYSMQFGSKMFIHTHKLFADVFTTRLHWSNRLECVFTSCFIQSLFGYAPYLSSHASLRRHPPIVAHLHNQFKSFMCVCASWRAFFSRLPVSAP